MKPLFSPQKTSYSKPKRKGIEIQDPQTLIKKALLPPHLTPCYLMIWISLNQLKHHPPIKPLSLSKPLSIISKLSEPGRRLLILLKSQGALYCPPTPHEAPVMEL
jgi:hypothetical protein